MRTCDIHHWKANEKFYLDLLVPSQNSSDRVQYVLYIEASTKAQTLVTSTTLVDLAISAQK